MLTAFRKKITVPDDGNIEIRSPVLKPGTKAEVIVLIEDAEAGQDAPSPKAMTAGSLLASGLVGLWARRKDITDSQEFARQLRKAAETREIKG